MEENSCVNRDDTGNACEDEEESETDERVEAYSYLTCLCHSGSIHIRKTYNSCFDQTERKDGMI